MHLHEILEVTQQYLTNSTKQPFQQSPTRARLSLGVENSRNALDAVPHGVMVGRLRNGDKKLVDQEDAYGHRFLDIDVLDKQGPPITTMRPLMDPPFPGRFVNQQYRLNQKVPEAARQVSFIHEASNVFLRTVGMAFAEHLPLRLKPDHILELLCNGFGMWMNSFGGAELLDAKKADLLIEVNPGPNWNPASGTTFQGMFNQSWDNLVDELTEQLTAAVPENLRPILLHKFSTTTPEFARAHTLGFAVACSKFVRIKLDFMCGISEIQLDGSLEDWQAVKAIANAILAVSQGKLEPWITLVQAVLDEFVALVEGKGNPEIWKDILFPEHDCIGSSTPGWINVFFPYIDDGWGKTVLKPNPCVWEQTWQDYVQRDRSPKFHTTRFSSFPSTALRATYATNCGPDVNVIITSGLLATVQWGDDAALEPWLSYQVDMVKTK